ncbi:MAG: SusD/RagB family nutrient-binding outer membrane lipoprotein [Chitinophagaceae bacterium]
MKNIIKFSLLLVLFANVTSCRKYFDVNSDPTSPQTPSLPSILIPATNVMSRTMAFDGRFIGQYIQNWSHTSASEAYDIHGGNTSTAGTVGSQLWRDLYQQQGEALNVIFRIGNEGKNWDYMGVAAALRAWGFQQGTDYFGEMPFYQAWEQGRAYFDYDTQDVIYKGVDSICRSAIAYLDRTDGAVPQNLLARGDQIYNGDRNKWKKFVYGILARNYHHQTNKVDYKPDSVIKFVSLALSSNADNFYVKHTASRNDDTNPWGPARDNLSVRRQSRFAVQLLDGTIFTGSSVNKANRDPRLTRMLSASPDTTTINAQMPTLNGGHRFLTPAAGFVVSAANRATPSSIYGDSIIVNSLSGVFQPSNGKYIFRNGADYPVMTYGEMQFILAEAYFRKGDLPNAFIAYRNGINASIDMVNTFSPGNNITATERAAYLASANVVQLSNNLTISDIMLQKYINDFGWNFIECWTDMRRYHYNIDLDPATSLPVYRTFSVSVFSSLNLGPKFAYRFRPTSFSEYDWNIESLRKIGALNDDYHTYEMWFSQP